MNILQIKAVVFYFFPVFDCLWGGSLENNGNNATWRDLRHVCKVIKYLIITSENTKLVELELFNENIKYLKKYAQLIRDIKMIIVTTIAKET